MFRHIVLCRFKAGTSDEQKATFKRTIEAFRESCPMVRRLECGSNLGSGPNHFEFATVIDFDDRPSFRAYIDSAPHQAYVQGLGKVIIEQLAVVQHEF